MKEWILENTTVTEEEYDDIMIYQNNLNENLNELEIKLDRKRKILFNILVFNLRKPTLLNRFYHNINLGENSYIYENIKFKQLYDVLKNPNLHSIKRINTCYKSSISLALLNKCDIVVAICTNVANERYLHAFNVTKGENGQELVLDYSLNLLMIKEDYYDLMEVEEVEYIKYKYFEDYINSVDKNIELVRGNILYEELLVFNKEIRKGILK